MTYHHYKGRGFAHVIHFLCALLWSWNEISTALGDLLSTGVLDNVY